MTNLAELRRQAKLPAKQAGGAVVSQFFEANRATLAAVLPRHVTPDRMMKLALGAIRANPKLLECSTESLFGALVLSSQLGLEPNTPLGHAYLIPFRDNRNNRTDVQFIPGYRGLIDLARRSGQIISISAHAVHAGDYFDFAYGLDERLEHRPAARDRGEIIAFYAVAKLHGGGHQFEVMWRDEVDAIRDQSQGYRIAMRYAKRDSDGNITSCNSPWHTHYPEMGRKTAVRRLFKYLPVSIEMATAVALDDAAETAQPQGLDNVLTGEWSVDTTHPEDTPPAGMDPETGEIRDREPGEEG